MDNRTRVAYFENLLKQDPYAEKDLYYQGRMQKLPVYRIELKYLVYNEYNGRIASRVKSYEHETGIKLDSDNEDAFIKIEEFLEESHKNANDKTFASICNQGQKEVGIVTKDGVVIDGNRRTMLLRRKEKETKEPQVFQAVILDDELSKNRKEILLLETQYQIGEDAKADYHPIENYLKIKDMLQEGFSIEEIAQAMAKSVSEIKENISILGMMDEYLSNLGYSEIYTRLYKTEDFFINLDRVYKQWSNTGGKLRWNPDESDLDDFKLIMFDYARYAYNISKGVKVKDIRDNFLRNSENNPVAIKKIWDKFSKGHGPVDEITEKEETIDDLRKRLKTNNLSGLYEARDKAWATKVDSHIKENYGQRVDDLENYKSAQQPVKLLSQAYNKLLSINQESEEFYHSPEVFELVDTIRKWSDNAKSEIKAVRKSNKQA